MTEFNFWGTDPQPGTPDYGDDNQYIRTGNTYFIDPEEPGDFFVTGARVYLHSLTGLEDATAINLHFYTNPLMTGNPVLSKDVAKPGAPGWVDVEFDDYHPVVKGQALHVAVTFYPDDQKYIINQFANTATVDAAVGPLKLSSASGESTGVATWGARTSYRYGNVTTAGNEVSGGWLAGVDLIITDEEPSSVYVWEDMGTETPTETWHVKGVNRTEENTGLAAVGLTEDDLTTYSGSMTITGTVSNKVINATGVIHLKDNAQIDRCLINSAYDPAVSFEGSGAKLTNSNVHVSGEPMQRVNVGANRGLGAEDGILISNVYTTGGTVQLWCDVGATIEDFYGDDQMPETGGEQHRDGFTRRDSNAKILIRRSRFVCDEGSTTGAFFVQDTFGNNTVGNIYVTQSMFEGAGYCLTLEDASDLTFVDNIVYSRMPHQIGPLTVDGASFALWQDNYQYNPDNSPTFRGSIINEPENGSGPPPDDVDPQGTVAEQLEQLGFTITHYTVNL